LYEEFLHEYKTFKINLKKENLFPDSEYLNTEINERRAKMKFKHILSEFNIETYKIKNPTPSELILEIEVVKSLNPR